MLDVYFQASQQCVDDDGAGALILYCAGISDLKGSLEKRLAVPVISGVVSAIKVAEQLTTW